MQSPSPNHSKPSVPPAPRHLRWAARLTLLVASLGAVATSPASSPDVFSEYEGPPLSLTTEAPTATRHFKVRVFAEEHSFNQVEVELTAQVTARWRPADPSSTVKPWLLARLYMPPEPNPGPGKGEVLTLGEPGQQVTMRTHTTSLSDCKLGQECEWSVPLEFELQPNATAGTGDVEWKMMAAARAVDTTTLPKGFTVQISEQ